MDGWVVLLPELPGGAWAWWRIARGRVLENGAFSAGDTAPWDDDPEPVVVLAPAALAPVVERDLPDLPLAQALAAERLALGAAPGAGALHVAVAADLAAGRVLAARVAVADIERWLADLAGAGLTETPIVPAALVLARPSEGVALARLADSFVARGDSAAFAGEPALAAAFGEPHEPGDAAVGNGLAATLADPPLDLRQGAYAPRRIGFLAVPDWRPIARMAAVVVLLALALAAVRIVRWNADADAREAAVLAAAQKRFPGVTDLAGADRLASAELARRSGAALPGQLAALLGAVQPLPASLRVSQLAYTPDGALRVTAGGAGAPALTALADNLRRDGWTVEAPDDPAAATATLTVRAP